MKPILEAAGLTSIGFLTRLWWIWSRTWTAGDTPDYLIIARNLVLHHLFSLSNGEDWPLSPTAQRPPLYPMLIATLWWIHSPSIVLILLLQAVLGAATVLLVYRIAADRFNRAVAVIACLGMALAPMTGYFTAVVLTETLFTFLLTLAIFLWGREKPALAGVVFGIAALTRPVVLPFVVVLPFLSLLPPLRQRWKSYLTVALVAISVSSVWILRNALVFGRFIPIAASGWGMNLLCGTIDTEIVGIKVWTGSEWALLDLNDHPLVQVDRGMSETERDRVLMRRGLERIVENPGHWLLVRAEQYPKLFLDSGNYLLGSHNIPISQALAKSRVWVLLVKGLFLTGNLFVMAIALLGVLDSRERVFTLIHLIAFPIFLLLVQLPMWAESRYSLPIMPMVAIFFAAGWMKFTRRIKFDRILQGNH